MSTTRGNKAITTLAKYQVCREDMPTTWSSWDASTMQGFPWLVIGSLSAAEHLFRCKSLHLIGDNQQMAKNLPIENGKESKRYGAIQHVQVDLDEHPIANLWPILETCLACLDGAALDHETHQHQQRQQPQQDNNGVPFPTVLAHCPLGASRSMSVVLVWLLLCLTWHVVCCIHRKP